MHGNWDWVTLWQKFIVWQQSFLSNFMSVFSLKVNSWPLNSCHKRPLCIGDSLTGLGEDGREGDGTDGIDTGTDWCSRTCAVKLKSFTVVKFSVCAECCSLSLRDGKCSKRIFLAADGLILGEALHFFNIDWGVEIGVEEKKDCFLAESGAGLITDSWSETVTGGLSGTEAVTGGLSGTETVTGGLSGTWNWTKMTVPELHQ